LLTKQFVPTKAAQLLTQRAANIYSVLAMAQSLIRLIQPNLLSDQLSNH